MSNVNDVMNQTMAKMKELVDVNSVVGNPINTPDGTTLIPVSKVTFGFASGGSDGTQKAEKAAFGAGSGGFSSRLFLGSSSFCDRLFLNCGGVLCSCILCKARGSTGKSQRGNHGTDGESFDPGSMHNSSSSQNAVLYCSVLFCSAGDKSPGLSSPDDDTAASAPAMQKTKLNIAVSMAL